MAPRQRCPSPPAEIPSSSSPLLLERKSVDGNEDPCLPTETVSESDIARDQHDIFNLIALQPVIWLMVANWDLTKFMTGHGPETSWTGNYFMEMWVATLVYFVIDLVWVARVPICVKSPGVIVKHHCIAILYLIAPLMWEQYRWFMGACLSVEINTWFLIARRVVYKRKVPAPLVEAITSLFYISWILIRCIIYPAILVVFLHMARTIIQASGSWLHLPLLFVPIHFFLCILNLKWSYDLFEPIIRRWWTRELEAKTVSSGL